MFSKEELELQYYPKFWVKRGDPLQIVALHKQICENASNAARRKIPHQFDVPFGDSDGEKLDIYGTDLPPEAPILIYVHGGYWKMLSKDSSAFAAESLYKHGIKLITLGYDLCPTVAFSTVVHQVQKGIAHCLRYAKENGSRGVTLCGHSAGAHLIASVFQQSFYQLSDDDKDMIKGAVFFSGVYDLIPIVSTTVNDNLDLDEDEAKKFSPLFHTFTAGQHTTFLVLVGEYESSAFHKQSVLLHNKLKNDGYNSKLLKIDKLDHFNIVENLQNENDEILKLIIKIME